MGPLSPQLSAYNNAVTQTSQGQQGPGLGWNNDIWNPNQNAVMPASNRGSQVLGVTNNPPPPSNVQLGPPAPTGPNPMDQYKQDISNKWDSYLGSLGGQQDFLNTQNTNQNATVNDQYTQGANSLQASGVKSIHDIGNNIRSAFQAGNNFLGAQGAGDSSAADQYSLALGKESGRQTANVNEFITGHMQDLASIRDQKLNDISTWFTQAQADLKQKIADGQMNKGNDLQAASRSILDQAIAATNNAHQEAQTRYNALVQWAAGNATSMQGLQSQIAQIPQPINSPVFNNQGQANPVAAGYNTGGQPQQKSIFDQYNQGLGA